MAKPYEIVELAMSGKGSRTLTGFTYLALLDYDDNFKNQADRIYIEIEGVRHRLDQILPIDRTFCGAPIREARITWENLTSPTTIYLFVGYQLTRQDALGRLLSIDKKLTPSPDYTNTKQVLPALVHVISASDGSLRPLRSWVFDLNGYAYLPILVQAWNGNALSAAGWYRTYASILAANNTAGLAHNHTKHNRNSVRAWIRCGGPCETYYYVSQDAVNWRPLTDNYGNLVFDKVTWGATEFQRHFNNLAYPYLRVVVPTPSIDIEIEVVSSAP